MKIQILGSGCKKCKKLHALVEMVVKKMRVKDEVEYLGGMEGTQKIIELGSMSSPVLAINDQIALAGSTEDPEKIKNIIQSYLDKK